MMTKLHSVQGKREDDAAAAPDQSNTYNSPCQATQKQYLISKPGLTGEKLHCLCPQWF